MRFDLVQDRLWAINQSKLEEINAFIVHMLSSGQKIEFAGEAKDYEKASIFSANNGHQSIALIPVFDTITQRANLFSRWSGGTSTDILQQDIRTALDDPEVIGLLLNVNSPGGTVHGTKAVADLIFESRGKKPIIAFCDGLMCSAAYWIGSSADSLIVSETALVGSIGVVATHYDLSKRDEQAGIVRTEIYAGKYKRIATDTHRLTDEGKASIQERVDTYYSIFVADVARGRGVDAEKALEMADGREFVGSQAVAAGLVDRIGTFHDAVKLIEEKSMSKEEFDALQKQLEEANAKIAELDVVKVEGEAVKAALEESKKKEAALSVELRKQQLESKVKDLVASGKIAPATVEAGMIDFLMAIDGVQMQAGEDKSKASDWLLDKVITASPKIVDTAGSHFAEKDTAKSRQMDDDEKLGESIAAYINPQLAAGAGSKE
jgi:signal peptide peptidase SppA